MKLMLFRLIKYDICPYIARRDIQNPCRQQGSISHRHLYRSLLLKQYKGFSKGILLPVRISVITSVFSLLVTSKLSSRNGPLYQLKEHLRYFNVPASSQQYNRIVRIPLHICWLHWTCVKGKRLWDTSLPGIFHKSFPPYLPTNTKQNSYNPIAPSGWCKYVEISMPLKF